MEVGVFSVAGLFIMALLFGIFPEFSPDFRLLSPVDQNLMRAGNGFALTVLSGAAFWWFRGLRYELNHLEAVIGNPGVHWPVITAAALVVYGLFRFVVGARQCWGCKNWPLTSRAVFTMALGCGGVWFLWGKRSPELFSNGWLALGWLLLLTIFCWWTCTGSIRFVLLTTRGGSALGAIWRHIRDSRVQWGSPGASAGTSPRDWVAEFVEAFRWHWHNEFKPPGQREKPQTFAQHVAGWVTGLAACAAIVCLIGLWNIASAKIFPPTTSKVAAAEVAATTPSPSPHHAKHHHAAG
jgi:hypothetical protein